MSVAVLEYRLVDVGCAIGCKMKCPHCSEAFYADWEAIGDVKGDADGQWRVRRTKCPSCDHLVFSLDLARAGAKSFEVRLVHPKTTSRAPLSPQVPEPVANDYRESCLVLADSPKASAALSRRCLQNILREHFVVKHGNLSDEIDEVLPKLPSHLADAVDAIRTIGNFAAHPMKSTNSGEIMDVEPGEAEWSLDVLEGLFDFCFVQPALLAERRGALNEKLADAGRPPLK